METQRTLSNIQQELLRLYARNIAEEDMLAIRRMLAGYFAQKAERAMEEFWDGQGLEPEDMIGWSQEHHRVETRTSV